MIEVIRLALTVKSLVIYILFIFLFDDFFIVVCCGVRSDLEIIGKSIIIFSFDFICVFFGWVKIEEVAVFEKCEKFAE